MLEQVLSTMPSALWWILSPLTIGLWLLMKRPHLQRGSLHKPYWILFAYLLFSGLFGLAHRLTGRGIDTSVVFHLQTGLDGTGWGDFSLVMALAAGWLVLSLALPALVLHWLGKPLQLLNTTHPLDRHGSRQAAASSLLLASWVLHPGLHDLSKLAIGLWGQPGQTQDPLYVQILKDSPGQTHGSKDLVWIYLESLELAYLDQERFPGLTPRLSNLARQGLNFKALQQVEGTGWTMAGMVASQCGTPLLTLLDGNALTGADRFMSNATCLGDLLKARGYQLDYLGGASLQFGGKGAFYKTHGFAPMGLEEILPQAGPQAPQTAWGLQDDVLYQQAWNLLERKADQTTPVGLVMLTLDTHHPHGHVSPGCNKVRYQDGKNPILNAVHCADHLIGQFVDRLQQHPRWKNALIVVSSDHLAMPNTATRLLDTKPRHNLMLALNTGLTPQTINRAGSTLDIAPTLLSWLGMPTPALGYGRDLLGTDKTLVEQHQEQVNDFLLSRNRFLARLWRYPRLDNGITLTGQHLLVDERRLNLPLLMQLDKKHKVSGLAYPAEKTLPELVSEMPASQQIVWVDQCHLILPLNRQANIEQDNICLAIGIAHGKWRIVSLHDGKTLDHQTLTALIKASDPKPLTHEGIALRKNVIANWLKWGTAEFTHSAQISRLKRPVAITSSGHPSRPSLAMTEDKTILPLTRGMTLLQLNPEGELRKIGHTDTCAQQISEAVVDPQIRQMPTLSKLQADKNTVAFILTAHDSAVCGPSELANLVQGSPFEQAGEIGFRQPYVGIWMTDGELHEFTAPSNQSITAVINPQIEP